MLLGLLAQAVPGHGDLRAALIGVKLDVVVIHRVGRVQANHGIGGEPAAFDEFFQHGLAVGIDLGRLHTDDLVLENGGERPGQVPGLEERAPVDELGQLGQVEILEHATSQELRFGRRVAGPVDRRFVGARFRQRPHRNLLFVGVLLAHPFVVGGELCHVVRRLVRQQALRHAHAARGVRHINHRALVMRRNLDGGVHARGGGAAYHQRNFFDAEVVVLLHLAGHVLHLLQAGGDQAGQAHNVGAFHLGAGQNLMAGHHHAHVDHVEVIALQHHGHDVFANVMHITLDGGDDDLALGAHIAPGGFVQALFFFDVRNQVRHRLFHDARTLDYLGQEHLALAEQVAHDVHAGHQRALDHVQRPTALGQNGLVRFFGVNGDEVGDAMHHGVAQALLHRGRMLRRAAPFQPFAFVLGRALGAVGNLDQTLASVRATVQHHVFDPFAQLRLEVVIHPDHAGVHDAHVHAGFDGVVQEHGVNGLAHRVVAAKGKAHVRHPA